MAITFVNAAATENSASATYTRVLTWSQTAGDLICVCIWTSGLTQTVTSVTDTKSNLYYQCYANQNAGGAAGGMNTMFLCANVAAAASSANTVTVVFGASQATATVGVMTFTSDDGFGYVDVLGGTSTNTSTTATRSLTTVNANDLVLGFVTTGSGKVTTVTTGTLALNTATNGKALAYAIRTTAAAQAITATVGATNDLWVVGSIAIQKTAPVMTGAGVPTLVQHTSTGSSAAAGGPFFICYPNKTLANNFLLAIVTTERNVGNTLTITDDGSNTWTMCTGYPIDDTFYRQTWIAYHVNTGANVNKVTFTFGSTPQPINFSAELLEYYNVATSSPQDGSGGNNVLQNATPLITCGSFTPGTAGDLIIAYSFDANINTIPPSYAPGPGFIPLTMHNGEAQLGKILMHTIQATSGAINPTAVMNGCTDFVDSYAVAFKSATSGTAPSASAMRVVTRWETLVSVTSPTLQFPTVGNLFFAQSTFYPNAVSWTVMTSNLGNTWTYDVGANTTIYPQFWHCANATPSTTFTVAPTLGTWYLTMYMYDIVNAATSPFDTTAGFPQQNKTNSANAPLTMNTATITPTRANGVVFCAMSNGHGPTTGVTSPTGAFMDSDTYTGQVDADNMCNADGYSHVYPTTTSTLTWTWTMNSDVLPSDSAFASISFLPPVTSIVPTLSTNPKLFYP